MNDHNSHRLGICLLALFYPLARLLAQEPADPKKPEVVFQVQDQLIEEDPLKKGKRHSNVYHIYLEAGKNYEVVITSPNFKMPLMSLFDLNRESVLGTADSSEGLPGPARLWYRIREKGKYPLVVSGLPEKTEKYTITARALSPSETFVGFFFLYQGCSDKGKKELVTEMCAYVEGMSERTTAREAIGAMEICWALHRDYGAGLASGSTLPAEGYRRIGNVLARSTDKRVAEFAPLVQGVGRRYATLGKEIEIRGATLEGKEIDVKQFRGKAVLVYFWATWDSFFYREGLAEMKNLYDTFHENGLEVIGVSIDSDKKTVADFLAKEKLPWPTIFDQGAPEGKRLAERYGISTVPKKFPLDHLWYQFVVGRRFLIDQKGRAVWFNDGDWWSRVESTLVPKLLRAGKELPKK